MDMKDMYISARTGSNKWSPSLLNKYSIEEYYKDVVREILRAQRLSVSDVYLIKNAPYVTAHYDYGRWCK